MSQVATTPAFGTFCVCRCVHPAFRFAGEFTNVGVSLYNEHGHLLLAMADTPERAIRRGDCHDAEHVTQTYFQNLLESYGTLDELRKHQQGFGYAMSCVQVQIGGHTMLQLGALNKLFEDLVLGVDRDAKPHVEWEDPEPD